MSIPNRAARIAKIQKVVKKHFQPVTPPADRSVLEHLLYACCLENAPFEKADEAFARLQQTYFDWNETRVTTIAELSEVVSALPDPAAAATRLKRTLQSAFETHYSFDLEFLRKQNIGKSVKKLEKYAGVTPFVIAYVTQSALGGHAIPVDDGVLGVLLVLDVISEAEAAKHHVPGMERAIPKSKGIEFASLLHQLGAEFFAAPHSPKLRGILFEVDPNCKSKLPKRGGKHPAAKDSADTDATSFPASATSASINDHSDKDADGTQKVPTASTKKKSSTKRLTRKKPR
jgi:endonuclease III